MDVERLQAYVGTSVMVLFVLLFAFILLWIFRPGTKKLYKDTASIPFRHENKPIPDDEEINS